MLTIKKTSSGDLLNHNTIVPSTKEENTTLNHNHNRNEYYKIFIILEGSGYHSIDFESYLLRKLKVYFIKPGQIHSIKKKPSKMYEISFSHEIIKVDSKSKYILNSLFFQHKSSESCISVDPSGLSVISNMMDIIQRELSRDSIDHDVISDLFIGSLKLIHRYMPNQATVNMKYDRIVFLYALIDQHMFEHKDVEFYSNKLSIGSKRLNQITKEHVNKTVTQIIHEKIITEIKRNLAFTNTPIKAISIDMGFKDLGYFCRFYKKHTGESPKEFRFKLSKL